MGRIIRESSALEPLIGYFLDAANTRHFRDALSILFLNGSVFEVFENTGICCLVSVSGSDSLVEESADLIEGRSKTKILPFVKEIARSILPGMIVALQQTGISSEREISDEDQIRLKLVAAVMTNMEEIEKKLKEMTGVFINGAFSFSDLLIVSAHKVNKKLSTQSWYIP